MCPHCSCAPCARTEPLCHLAAFKSFARIEDPPAQVDVVSVERTERDT